MKRTLVAVLALMLASLCPSQAGQVVRKFAGYTQSGRPVYVYVNANVCVQPVIYRTPIVSGGGHYYVKGAAGQVYCVRRNGYSNNGYANNNSGGCNAGPSSCYTGNRRVVNPNAYNYNYGQNYTGARYSTAPQPVSCGGQNAGTPYVGSTAPRYGP